MVPESTQWGDELPEVWKGWKIPFALSLLSGASTIVSSLLTDDKRVKYLGILFGSMETVGTASYAAGSYGLSRNLVEALIAGESQISTEYNQIKHLAIEVGSKLTRIGGGFGSALISGYSMYRSLESGNVPQGLTQGTMSVSGVLMTLGTIKPLNNLGSLGGRIGLVGIFASSVVSTVELTNQLFEEAASKPPEGYSTPWNLQQIMYRQNPNLIGSDWFRK